MGSQMKSTMRAVGLFFLCGTLFLSQGCLSFLIKRGFPTYSGELNIPGVQEPVHLYRDSYGIPHIYAQNNHDLYFSQGFVHAQDRLFQMETFRRMAQAQLAEIGGKQYAELDFFMHLLDAPRLVQDLSDRIKGPGEEMIHAYCEGVNAYISAHKNDLPVEFASLGLTPTPYTEKDALSSVVLISWFLNENYSEELMFLKALKDIPSQAFNDLFLAYPQDTPPAYLSNICRWDIAPFLKAAYAYKNLFQSFGGSNNWVVSGKKSFSGKPLLANDPHLIHSVPGFWYFNHLHSPEIHVTGASIAGAPGVVVGHTERAAWSITNLMADYVDLCVLRVDPQQPTLYFLDGKPHKMEEEEVLIKVKDNPSIRRKIYRTVHGPVITRMGQGQAQVALKWHKNVKANPFHSFFLMNQAASVKDIFKAGANLGMIAINLVAADVEGNIGWHATGNVPIRRHYTGCWPVDGCQSRFQWEGFIPYSELPSSFNPDEGLIVTANENRTGESYPYLISSSWAAPYRARRITKLLEEKEKLSVADYKRIQNDCYSMRAESIISFIKDFKTEDKSSAQAADIIKKWDRNVTAESGEAAVYELFLTALIRNLLEDELGEKLYFYFANMYKSLIVDDLLSKSDSLLWDRIHTPQKEIWKEIVEVSLVEAIEQAEKRIGENRNEWQWGKIHPIYYRHPGAESWITRQVMNYGPYPLGGDNTTVNYAGFNPIQGKFNVNAIASFRLIVDMADLGKTLIIGPMGQSGQPQHPHYHDMIDLWRNGRYIPLYFYRQDVLNHHKDLLVLK